MVWVDGMVAQVALDALGFCPQAAEASYGAETDRWPDFGSGGLDGSHPRNRRLQRLRFWQVSL